MIDTTSHYVSVRAVCSDQTQVLPVRQETGRPTTWSRRLLLLRLERQELCLRLPACPKDTDLQRTVQACEGTSRDTNVDSLSYCVVPFVTCIFTLDYQFICYQRNILMTPSVTSSNNKYSINNVNTRTGQN